MRDDETDSRHVSFWAWGWEDRLPDDEERRELKSQLEGLLDFPELPLLDLPGLEDVTMPPAGIEGPEQPNTTQSRRARARHTYGKGYRDLVRGFHGDYANAPDVVARPESEADVEELLAWATEQNVAVVPFGGGTSVVGGVECDGEGYAGVCSLVASDTLEEFGATITHHHAVGRIHRYHREVPDGYLDALRSVKRTLDPGGVMNPGALL